MKLKNKTQLDKLTSYEAVMNYRRSVLRSDIEDWRRYTDEIELYMDIRFKDVVIERYNTWRKKASDPNTEVTEKRMCELITKMTDNENMYQFYTQGTFKQLQPFKYINCELI